MADRALLDGVEELAEGLVMIQGLRARKSAHALDADKHVLLSAHATEALRDAKLAADDIHGKVEGAGVRADSFEHHERAPKLARREID